MAIYTKYKSTSGQIRSYLTGTARPADYAGPAPAASYNKPPGVMKRPTGATPTAIIKESANSVVVAQASLPNAVTDPVNQQDTIPADLMPKPSETVSAGITNPNSGAAINKALTNSGVAREPVPFKIYAVVAISALVGWLLMKKKR